MRRAHYILLAVTLALIAGTAGLLARVSSRQVLSPAGVKTQPSNEPGREEVILPAEALDYKSDEALEVDEVTKGTLPADTCFGQRKYKAPDGSFVTLNVVLMGSDRTSLHKPQFCLEDQGWNIDQGSSLETTVHVDKPIPYELPVVRLISSREMEIQGQKQLVKNIYVYWFVADDALSSSVLGFQRMWMMGSKLLRTGVLQRWAYISCSGVCYPGQEDATFERMKKFIAAAAPEFQLNPRVPQEAANR